MILIDVMVGLLALSILVVIWRLVVGPTDADRAAALDFGFFAFLAAISGLAIRLGDPALLDLVLTGTLVSFLATVALAQLVERRNR